jgi:hypothetical protein
MNTATAKVSAAANARKRLWLAAQLIGVVATLALLLGLVIRPEPSLNVLWNLLIPLVPASLLISPAIWRNVCPLATLNTLSNRSAGTRKLGANILPSTGLVGIVLLGVLVPARRFLFNTDGLALAVTVTAVAAAAIALGSLFDLKAGFCNSICPVLPVERLYGQRPLLRVGNPRCRPCTACTASACIDLDATRSVGQTLGAASRSHAWLRSGFGAFAAAFPGFVIGYYTLADGPLSAAGSVYVHIALWAAGSYLVTALLVHLSGVTYRSSMVVLAAAAVGLYYWYAADTVTTAWGIAGTPTLALRGVALVFVAFWAWRAAFQPARALRHHHAA